MIQDIFKLSLVKDISSWKSVEKSNKLPDSSNLPAFTGSGVIAYGLDSAGMQGLNCKFIETYSKWRFPNAEVFQRKYEIHPSNIHLHVYHKGMLSCHLNPDNIHYPGNGMPLGFFKYSIIIDDTKKINEGNIQKHVTNWSRDINLYDATITTTFHLDHKLRLKITSFIPQGKATPLFKFTFSSIDGKKHSVKLKIKLCVKTQNGAALFSHPEAKPHPVLDITDNRIILAGALASERRSYHPYETYELSWAMALDKKAAYRKTGSHWTPELSAQSNLKIAASGDTDINCLLVFGSSKSNSSFYDYMNSETTSFNSKGLYKILQEHKDDWHQFYSEGGDIDIGNSLRSFLFHKSLYLLRTGLSYDEGLPANGMFTHPAVWRDITCWDVLFMVDGMLRTNHLEGPIKFLKWLKRGMQPKGRPFYWATLYDGSTFSKDTDEAYFLMGAYALTVIKIYESSQDRELLLNYVYPICRAISEYARKKLFLFENGEYILRGSIRDLREPGQPERKGDLFTTCWFITTLAKTSEYAKILKIDKGIRDDWKGIADNAYLPNDSKRYISYDYKSGEAEHIDGWAGIEDIMDAEVIPFLNLKLYQEVMKNHVRPKPSDIGQPWRCFTAASWYHRINRPEDAETCIADGIKLGTYANGYFSEFTGWGKEKLHDVMRGIPPYLTAHGAYVCASCEQVIFSSIWEDNISIFKMLPNKLQNRNISFKNLRTLRGLKVSASYSPRELICKIESNIRKRVKAECLIPKFLRDKAFNLYFGKRRKKYHRKEGNIIVFDLTVNGTNLFRIAE